MNSDLGPPPPPPMDPNPVNPPKRWRAVLAAVEALDRHLVYRLSNLDHATRRLAAEMGDWSASLKAAAAEPPPASSGSWLEQATTARLIVHTVEGKSIEGTLALAAVDGVILRAAVLLEPGKSVPMAGEVFVPRAQVLFVQTKPTPA